MLDLALAIKPQYHYGKAVKCVYLRIIPRPTRSPLMWSAAATANVDNKPLLPGCQVVLDTQASLHQPCTQKASVAITGGSGGLGVLTAQWLVSHGCVSRVKLFSRSGRLGAVAGALLHAAACVTVQACDAGCTEDLGVMWRHNERYDAVFHAAGILQVSCCAKLQLTCIAIFGHRPSLETCNWVLQ